MFYGHRTSIKRLATGTLSRHHERMFRRSSSPTHWRLGYWKRIVFSVFMAPHYSIKILATGTLRNSSMRGVFNGATDFNQDISQWDTSWVTNMDSMFKDASSFNKPIGNWDVSDVLSFSEMFKNAVNFNQDISNWDISSATNLGSMFRYAVNFDQNISQWDTSNVTNMGQAFRDSLSFNQNLSDWNISAATHLTSMFGGATSLSDPNKAVMQYAFQGNPNWNTDWSSYVGYPPHRRQFHDGDQFVVLRRGHRHRHLRPHPRLECFSVTVSTFRTAPPSTRTLVLGM